MSAAHPTDLDAREQRILGCLLEKQVTVPATYPLSRNALRTACNQSNSRDPVVDWSEQEVTDGLKALRRRELVRVVHDGRVLKYHQLLDQLLGLDTDERALITVLLLRGAQSSGELKTRTDRLHAFADKSDAEACLQRLSGREPALVRELPRQPGQHDNRWVHLLGPVETGVPAAPAPTVDRDSVLATGVEARDARVRAAYGVVAGAYAQALAGELAGKPFDRWLLQRVAELVGPLPVVDVGCGPGQVAGFLASCGASVTGLDIAPEMVERARELFPAASFEVGDLRTLMRPRAAAGWGAITAWYAVVHLGGSELPAAVGALARTLAPGGWLALATHIGDAVLHEDTFLGHEVDLDVVLHDPAQVRAAVAGAGLEVVEWYLRGPLAGEAPTERLYLLARLGY